MLSRNRTLRVVEWVLVPPLALWLGYLIFANLYLNANGIELTLEAVDDVADVDLGSAFTWWPGYVIAKDLRVIVHDSNVEMDLRIEDVHANVTLTSLFSKEFETRTATVGGVSLRLRKTRPLAGLCRQPRGLPPIDGLALPPGAGRRKCRDQVDTAHRRVGPPTPAERLFRVRLGGLVIHDLREIWIEPYRVTGAIEASGRMNFWPKKEVGFAIASLRASGVALDMAQARRIEGAEVTVRGAMDNLQIQHAPSATIWRAISMRAKLKVRDVDLQLVERMISNAGPIAPPKLPHVEGRALLDGELVIQRGWTRRVRVHAAAMQASLRLVERTISGHAVADLTLVPAPGGPGVLAVKQARVVLTDVGISGDDGVERFEDEKLEVNARGETVLSPAKKRLSVKIHARSRRSEPLLELMPGGFKKAIAKLLIDDDAPATVIAELSVDEDVARFEHLLLQAGELRVEGRMRLAPDPGGRARVSYRGIELNVDL